MNSMSYGEDVFARIGDSIFSNAHGLSNTVRQRRFAALFGVSPSVCASTWAIIWKQLPDGSEPKHLIWALLFLKVYATEHVNCALTGVDCKTFRKWVWIFLRIIACCKLVSSSSNYHLNFTNIFKINWNDRIDTRKWHGCYVSVDGTDFKICEPTPWSASYYCHKHNGPGLRYEIAISIYSGKFVWAHGPFPCGSHSDLVIFRSGLKKLLQNANEKAIADKGYRDSHCIIPGMSSNESFTSRIRARHESANGRLKSFHVLSHRFRHSLNLHSVCFFSVLNLTHLHFLEHPLFNL